MHANNATQPTPHSEKRIGLVLADSALCVLFRLAANFLDSRLDDRALNFGGGFLGFGAFGFGEVFLGLEGGDAAGSF